MEVVKGYRVISIPLGQSAGIHSFYIKEHTENRVDKNGCTLFVGNIDYCGERSHQDIDSYTRMLLNSFGEIESISVSQFANDKIENRTNARFAHVVFANKKSIKLAMSAKETLFSEIGESIAQEWGVQHGLKKRTRAELNSQFQYRHELEDISSLKSEVNEYLKDFEESEASGRLDRLRASNAVDDDGFMPVHHRKKKKRSDEKRGAGKSRVRRPKKELELKNFYRFQMIDEKKEKLKDLRQKFEEDKDRIAHMKANRKFKPF